METIKTDSGITVSGANAKLADLRPIPIPRHVAKAYLPKGGKVRVLLEVDGRVEAVLFEGEEVAKEGKAATVQAIVALTPEVAVEKVPKDTATILAEQAAEKAYLDEIGKEG